MVIASGCTRQAEPSRPSAPTPSRFKALDEQTLADQSPDTQATFRAAHENRAAEEWISGHNRQLLEGLAGKAVLSASPNPVSTRASAGTTTIQFAMAGTHREQLLRTVTVTRANDVAATLWPVPAIIALVLLAGGLVAGACSRPRPARLLKVSWAVVATALVVWLALTTVARPLDQQPFPDSHEYADAARHLAAGDGYVTTVHGDGPRPPRYPPGFSLALVPFAASARATPTAFWELRPGWVRCTTSQQRQRPGAWVGPTQPGSPRRSSAPHHSLSSLRRC